MPRTDDPRDTQSGQEIGAPIRGPFLSGMSKGLDNERRKPPSLPRIPVRQSFEAKIATEVGGGEYTFTAQHLPTWDAGDSEIDWLTPEDGNFHPKTGTCYEANLTTGIAVDTIIHVREIRGLDGLPFYCFFRAAAAAWTTIAGVMVNDGGSFIGGAAPPLYAEENYSSVGVKNGESWALYPFELDGDNVAVAQAAASVDLAFPAPQGEISVANAATVWSGSFDLNATFSWIKSSYDADTINWAGAAVLTYADFLTDDVLNGFGATVFLGTFIAGMSPNELQLRARARPADTYGVRIKADVNWVPPNDRISQHRVSNDAVASGMLWRGA